MASDAVVALVREYTDEPDQAPWTDQRISELVDELGVESATARIWREKAARYSHLVDVTEAGASRKMSQAFAHARQMGEYWDGVAGTDSKKGKTRVHPIVRE